VERADVEAWVSAYVRAWRSPGTERLAEIFTPDVAYLLSPWRPAIEGIEAVAAMWEAERDGPDEGFTFASEVVAVDGDTAVVRAEVEYSGPDSSRWRDLWVLRFAGDGRCQAFEEWPFAPSQRDGH
jgi:ketosteroid isomerase-like protein